MSIFALPDLGEGLTEAEIVRWHVSENERVVADQPLVSVETDKAVVEIPAPHAGRVVRILAAPGDVIAVGAPLVELDDELRADAGSVVGSLPREPAASADGSTAKVETKPPGSRAAPPVTKAPASPAREPRRPAVRAMPSARALARATGVDLEAVEPSGPGGTIMREDVERAAAAGAAPAVGAGSVTPVGGAGDRDADLGPLEKLHGARRVMARNMELSRDTVAPATVTDEADVEDWPEGERATVRLLRAVAAACRAEPALNAWYDGAAAGRRVHEQVDVALAVDTDEGLFAPVVRDAGNRSADELGATVERLVAEVTDRSIAPSEFREPTITLSNFGTIGGRFAALAIVPPQVAIIGAGRIAARVVAHDGEPRVRRQLPLSLTFDHRAVTGGEAARFLAALVTDLERAE